MESKEESHQGDGNMDDNAPRYLGACKWFNVLKGFGFLLQDGSGEEIFVHQVRSYFSKNDDKYHMSDPYNYYPFLIKKKIFLALHLFFTNKTLLSLFLVGAPDEGIP